MNNIIRIRRLCLAALFLSLGWLLPLITGQIQTIGNMLCPMHIPVFLCGLILGPIYGAVIGFITPLSRILIFGMPVFYPNGLCMAFELAIYGLVSGLLYKFLKKDRLTSIYFSLIPSMILGRIIWGISMYLCGLVSKNSFTWILFVYGAFINAWPGILIQLIIIPILIKSLIKSNILEKFSYRKESNNERNIK